MSKGPFGEGAERFAFRFFEFAADQRTIVGPALVAKESRLILDHDGVGDEQARKKFCANLLLDPAARATIGARI